MRRRGQRRRERLRRENTQNQEVVVELSNDDYQLRLLNILEGISSQRPADKITSLKNLLEEMRYKNIPYIFKNRLLTLLFDFANSLQNGFGQEKILIAELIFHLYRQLGNKCLLQLNHSSFNGLLFSVIFNCEEAEEVKVKCTNTLGQIHLLTDKRSGEVKIFMSKLMSTIIKHQPGEDDNLVEAAIITWASLLKLLVLPSNKKQRKKIGSPVTFINLIFDQHKGIRKAARDALVAFYKWGTGYNENFQIRHREEAVAAVLIHDYNARDG